MRSVVEFADLRKMVIKCITEEIPVKLQSSENGQRMFGFIGEPAPVVLLNGTFYAGIKLIFLVFRQLFFDIPS